MRFRGVDYPNNITLFELSKKLNEQGQFEDFADRLKNNHQIEDLAISAQEIINQVQLEEERRCLTMKR